MQRTQFRGLVRFLYNHNPFYLVSAGLILYGLHTALGGQGWEAASAWKLAASLCSYTILMAVTAVIVVRFGKVWDDARTILLVLLLQFVAISVSFDELCRSNHEIAVRVLPACFLFTLLISESVLRLLRMRLPWLYRMPYYLLLGLMFGYPLLLSDELTGFSDTATSWLILLFPAACGVAFLTLIPAVRRGLDYVRENGTPWRWPMYPWSIFVFLSFVVCFRSWLLSYSFDPRPVRGLESAFGGYFLVPFGFALLVVSFESGIARGRTYAQTIALSVAPLLLLAAIPIGESATYRAFLSELVETAGSPIWLTLIALSVFYCYARLRGVASAENGIMLTLLIVSFVGPKTINLGTVESVKWWPWAAIAAMQYWRVARHPSSSRLFFASVLATVACAIAIRETPFANHSLAVSFHLLMLGAILAGMLFRDRAAFMFCRLAALLTVLGCWGAIVVGVEQSQVIAAVVYLALVTFAASQFWRLSRYWSWLWATIANTSTALLLSIASAYWLLYRNITARAFLPLAIGSAAFYAAALISAKKSGLLGKIWARIVRYVDEHADRPSGVLVQRRS